MGFSHMICRMFRMAGDVWGEYDQEGIRFTLLTREKVGRYQVSRFISGNMVSSLLQFQGKWSTFMQSVKEGNCRFGADLTQVGLSKAWDWFEVILQDAVVTTLGTFQLLKVATDSTKAEVSEAVIYLANHFPPM